MNGNSFGTLFRITTWGESHGPASGVIIDGCPSGLALQPSDFEADLGRRRGGQNPHTTPRVEKDLVAIESGVFSGITTGTPISLRIANENTKSSDYDAFQDIPRPGHADYTTWMKHGHRDHRGGGRSSARETAARVAAGVVARKLLAWRGIRVAAFVQKIGARSIEALSPAMSLDEMQQLRNDNPLALPIDMDKTKVFLDDCEQASQAKDSLGGAIEIWVDGLPVGWGEPVFDKLNAIVAHGLMSLPAAVGVETGGGIALSEVAGSQVRDPLTRHGPASNRHGGILGGMSSGTRFYSRVHFHAPTSIPQPIESARFSNGQKEILEVKGRHDSVPLPRAVPMAEAMVLLALVDAMARAGALPPQIK